MHLKISYAKRQPFCPGGVEFKTKNMPVQGMRLGGGLKKIFYSGGAEQHPYPKSNWDLLNPLQWRHSGRDSVSNHQSYDCLLNGLFKRRSKKIWELRSIETIGAL